MRTNYLHSQTKPRQTSNWLQSPRLGATATLHPNPRTGAGARWSLGCQRRRRSGRSLTPAAPGQTSLCLQRERPDAAGAARTGKTETGRRWRAVCQPQSQPSPPAAGALPAAPVPGPASSVPQDALAAPGSAHPPISCALWAAASRAPPLASSAGTPVGAARWELPGGVRVDPVGAPWRHPSGPAGDTGTNGGTNGDTTAAAGGWGRRRAGGLCAVARYSRRRADGRAAPGHDGSGGRCCGTRSGRCGSDPEPDRGAGKRREGEREVTGSAAAPLRPAAARCGTRSGRAAAAPSAGRGREARSGPGWGEKEARRRGKGEGEGEKGPGKGKGKGKK